MSRFLYYRRMYILLAIILGLSLVLDNSQPVMAQEPEISVQWGPAVRIPSPEESDSWFPDLAIDSQNRVHVVWVETKRLDKPSPKSGTLLEESVYYSRWDGNEWLEPNELVDIIPDIVRNSIAIDQRDMLHLLYDWPSSSNFNLYYKRAPVDEGYSAAAYTTPHRVNTVGGTYLNDIATYEDALHIIYDDSGVTDKENGLCGGACADIFYRRSLDGGQTWLPAVALFPTELGSARSQIEIDKTGGIHVTWDEGWDRRSGIGEAQSSVYMYSSDQGKTWSEPLIVTYPNSNNAQLTPNSNGEGGVMLVWRTHSPDYPGIYYMWSTDQGESWSPPRAIPNILSRADTPIFDMYDMATDSAGNIHLLVSGYLPDRNAAEKSPGLYHLVWDGMQWSTPVALYDAGWLPEYPHIIVHQGNQLHATWFIREDAFNPIQPNQVWYAHGWTDTPEIKVIQPTATSIPTPTPLPPTPTPIPTPTIDPNIVHLSVPPGATDTIYTEVDDVLLLIQSILPALLIVVFVLVGWRLRHR